MSLGWNIYWTVLIAIGVFLFTAIAEHLIHGGHNAEYVERDDGTRFKRRTLFNRVTPRGWGEAGILAGMMAIAYLMPCIFPGALWLGPVCYALGLAASGWVIYRGVTEASRPCEVLWLLFDLGIIFWVTMSAAAVFIELIGSHAFWESVINLIPLLALIVGVLAIAASACRYHYTEVNEESVFARVLFWVLIGLAVLATILLLIFSVKWGVLAKPVEKAEQPAETMAPAETAPPATTPEPPVTTESPVATPEPTTEPEPEPWYYFLNGDLQNDKIDNNNFNYAYDVTAEHDGMMTVEEGIAAWKVFCLNDPDELVAALFSVKGAISIDYLAPWLEAHNDNDGRAMNAAVRDFMADESLHRMYYDAFFKLVDNEAIAEVRKLPKNKVVKDMMYENPYTPDGIPELVAYECGENPADDQYLVLTFVVKGKIIELWYHINCGFQLCNPSEVLKIEVQVNPTNPEPTPTPAPTPTPTSTPTPSGGGGGGQPSGGGGRPSGGGGGSSGGGGGNDPAPSSTPKDPKAGEPVGGNDDPGITGDPFTGTGVGSRTSSEDLPTNSNHDDLNDYHEEIYDDGPGNPGRAAGEPNTPTASPPPNNAATDNNGDTGTGNGSADAGTPVSGPLTGTEEDTGQRGTTEGETGGTEDSWGGPPL